jgi:hypothetical protein
MQLQTAPARVAQLALFDRSQYRSLYAARSISQMSQTPQYRRWWCSPRRDRQRYEALVRQKFKCDACGYVLNPRSYDVHHARGYGDLGYESDTDLVAVHRICHRRLEDAARRDRAGCGCGPVSHAELRSSAA